MENYRQAVSYIEEIPKFTKKHTLEEVKRFYRFIGSPCADRQIIHVAGTNGKGSVCAYLRNLLEETGHHTAVFVSPHLVSVRERFLFDGKAASREKFLQAFERVYESVCAYRELCQKKKKKTYHPAYFEYLFFMFLVMEETMAADRIILETGLGGRLDATNIMPEKLLCIITRIGFDHTEYLGNTLQEIALEKAGILRPNVPLIYADAPSEAAEAIKNRADGMHVPAFPVGSCDFKFEEIRDKNIAFSFQSVYYNFISLHLPTTALYQTQNAALALRAAELLDMGETLTPERMERALLRTCWEGRMEEVLPDVYIDGAHNEDGIRVFLESVAYFDKAGSNHLVFAVVNDKRYEEMLRLIAGSDLFASITITQTGGKRATDPEALLAILKTCYGGDCVYVPEAEAAFDHCLKVKGKKDRVFAAGSLYLAGQLKAHIGRHSDD